MAKNPALKPVSKTGAVSTLNLGPVKIPRAADVLANQLRDEIVGGRLADGEMLPNERELADSSGLSRSSVRDALRMLELEGLIVTKQGRNGGSRVCKPGRDTIVKTVSLFISSRRTRRVSLVEARGAPIVVKADGLAASDTQRDAVHDPARLIGLGEISGDQRAIITGGAPGRLLRIALAAPPAQG